MVVCEIPFWLHAICCIQLISGWGTSWNQRIGGWRKFATIIRRDVRACRSMETHLVPRWLFPANASQSPGAERCSVAFPRNDCWSLGRSAERVVWQRAGWISSMSASKPWAFRQFRVFYHLDEAGSCLPYLQRSETTTQLVKMQVTWWRWEYRLLNCGRLWLDNFGVWRLICTDGDEWKIQVSDAFVFLFFFFNLLAILSQQPGSPSSQTQQTLRVNTFFFIEN